MAARIVAAAAVAAGVFLFARGVLLPEAKDRRSGARGDVGFDEQRRLDRTSTSGNESGPPDGSESTVVTSDALLDGLRSRNLEDVRRAAWELHGEVRAGRIRLPEADLATLADLAERVSDAHISALLISTLWRHEREEAWMLDRALELATTSDGGQIEAILLLEEMRSSDPRIVPALLSALRSLRAQADDTPGYTRAIHYAICHALAAQPCGSQEMLEELVAEVDGRFPEQALGAVERICEAGFDGSHAADELWERLPDLHGEVRQDAIRAFGAVSARSTEGFGKLVTLLGSEEARDRVAVVEAMRYHLALRADARVCLARLLIDRVSCVRESAARALISCMGDTMVPDVDSAVAGYVRRLGSASDSCADELLSALQVFAACGPSSSLTGREVLAIGLRGNRMELRLAALEAYAKSEDDAAAVAPALGELLRGASDMEAQRAVAAAIGRIVVGRDATALRGDEIERHVLARSKVCMRLRVALDEEARSIVGELASASTEGSAIWVAGLALR